MSSDLHDRLALLKKQYASSFAAKREELEMALPAALEGRDDGLAHLRHLAHKLAGSGASYGFTELSGLAKRLEGAVIARQQGMPGADIDAVGRALTALLDAEAAAHG